MVLKRTPQLQLLGKDVSITQTAALDRTEAGREGARGQKTPDFSTAADVLTDTDL